MITVKKRIEWVDIGKYICIMFVMLSHLESGSQGLTKFYTPFFLSGFFFLSGYVYRQPESFRAHFAKKARGLLLPWFLFSNGAILLSLGLSKVTGSNADVDYLARFGWNLVQIRTMGDELWFVNALFVAFIPFYFFAKWEKPGWALAVMAGLDLLSGLYIKGMPGEWFPWGLNALPWHLEFAFQAGLWMLLGYDFKRFGEKRFDEWNTPVNRAGLVLVYLLLVFGPASEVWLVRLRSVPELTSLVGILALTALCKTMKSNAYVRFVGGNTLTYFALHGWVYAAVELVLAGVAGGFYRACLRDPIASSLLAVAITVVVSVVLIIPARIINAWFPWVLGRKKEKHAV